MAGGVPELVEHRAVPAVCRREDMTRRHLDVIGAERVERSVAADPYCDAAVRDDALGSVRRAPGCFSGSRRCELGNTLDLARVKQREGAQQQNVPCSSFLVVFRTRPRIRYLEALEKVGCRSASALLHLPAALGGLFVGGPTRVGAGKC